MQLTEEIITKNKETVLQLLNSIERDGFKKSELISYLESSDFFIAPASTKYHNAIKGGLCDHCLNVYYNLKSLVKNKHLEDVISEESIIICSLLHDLSKVNFYKEDYRNKKQYSETGSKKDEAGNFDWVTVKEYKVIPTEERFVYGNHEDTAEYLARQFVPLTWEESTAIANHMAGMSFDSVPDVYAVIFGRNKLAVLLHVADTISTYLDE